MAKKVYIIGNNSGIILPSLELEYYKAQLALCEMGFYAINPIERLLESDISWEQAQKKNLQDLITSDAIYILQSFDITKITKELKIAFSLDLIIISGICNLNENSHQNSTTSYNNTVLHN